MKNWSAGKTKGIVSPIKQKYKLLKQLQDREDAIVTRVIKCLQKELNTLMGQESTCWKQRANRNWYRNGDHNTKFFHVCASQRIKKNQISSIIDENNILHTEKFDIARTFHNFFVQLHVSSSPTNYDIEQTKHMELRIYELLALDINRIFTREEVEQALFQMGPLKSSGLNGLGACFYQKFWKVVGGDICAAVLKILRGDGMIPSLNPTYIALISKNCNPIFVTKY